MIVSSLSFRHPAADRAVLDEVSFEAGRGAINAILGPNGSGKTTLFKCVAGLWKPQTGSVSYQNHEVLSLSERARARLIAVVPQDHEPPFPYSVRDVVLMGRAAHVGAFASPGKHDLHIANEALTTLGIDPLRNKPYTQISGGERQLVLVARALAQQSPILLLDEPTSHLDFRNQLRVLLKVREIARERNITVLMTLHDPNLALLFADNVIVLSQGKVQVQGQADQVITAETMASVYGVEVVVLHNNGTRVISPKVAR
jgi:iron complex transport system ATP-binding protein